MIRFVLLLLMVVMATFGLAGESRATDRAAFVIEGLDVSDFVLRGAVVSPRAVLLRDVSPRVVLRTSVSPRVVLLRDRVFLRAARPRVAVVRSLGFGLRATRLVRPRVVLRAVALPRRCR